MRGGSDAKSDSQSLGAEPLTVKNARSSFGAPFVLIPPGDSDLQSSATMDGRLQELGTLVNSPGSRHTRGGKMSGTVKADEAGADSRSAERATWVRRSEVPPFSPAPGIQVQPVIGKSLMTCWIAMEPGAVVAEHSHPNEQLGVVIEGSVTLTVEAEARELVVGDAYLVPSDLVHKGVAGADGVLLVESFVPVREEYAKAWRAIAGE
jgi:quercetin dioxygenase-like cupin family protein